jgi:dTMP kinase
MGEDRRKRVSGLFITFEGGDGSGKSTQIATLAARLQSLGADVRTFREPGGVTPDDAGERIRTILLDPAHMGLDVRAELLLYEASRAQLTAQHYRPALAEGAVVLCDRYADSSVAYQGYGRDVLPVDEVRELNRIATGGLVPDLTLLLDIEAADGLATASAAGPDRLELAGLEFHERVRAGYLAIAAAEPERVKLVPRGSVEEVAAAIWTHVEPLLARAGLDAR